MPSKLQGRGPQASFNHAATAATAARMSLFLTTGTPQVQSAISGNNGSNKNQKACCQVCTLQLLVWITLPQSFEGMPLSTQTSLLGISSQNNCSCLSHQVQTLATEV